jgi:MarC family membrane protein
MSPLEIGLRSFTTFFATIGPIDVAALFAVLAAHASPQQRRWMVIKGTLIAYVVILAFVVAGETLLALVGITLAAVRTAGGILLLLVAIDMVLARPSGLTSTTSEEATEAAGKTDISVFPLATPLIAGPGALGAAILLAAETQRSLAAQAAVIAALTLVMALTLVLLLVAGRLHAILGVTGQNVISRVIGILLAALAVQFMFDGISGSGLV